MTAQKTAAKETSSPAVRVVGVPLVQWRELRKGLKY